MKLFELPSDPVKKWLPKDGTVHYYGKIFSVDEVNAFREILLKTIAWRNDEAIIFGKKVLTKRKVDWYGERPFTYTYSKTTKTALSWTRIGTSKRPNRGAHG